MKKGEELNLTIIKCTNKTGCESLKALHREINDCLYDLRFKYIDQQLAIERYVRLCDCGKRLSELQVPEAAKAKKSEILGELRKRCLTLKEYKQYSNNFEEVPQMQATINFFLHTWIEQKSKELSPEIVISYLRESKRIYDAFFPFMENLKVDTLLKANGEMVNYFDVTFGLRH